MYKIYLVKISLLLLSLLPEIGFCQTQSTRPMPNRQIRPPVKAPVRILPKKLPPRSPWRVDHTWEWVNGLTYRDLIESQINPFNRVLEVDRYGYRMDLIYSLKASYLQSWKFVFVPRFTAMAKQITYSNNGTVNNLGTGRAELIEAHSEYSFSPYWNLGLGLQNYQWGPAEFFSPSNGFFHFNLSQKSVLWREKGKVLARMNWTIGKSWSLILFSELMTNSDPEWIADLPYNNKAMAKLEYRSSARANRYFGITGGNMENNHPFMGSYLSFSFNDTVSFYLDARSMTDPKAYYPQFSNPYYNMTLRYHNGQSGTQSLSLIGLRIETERTDFRLEYLANSMGYGSAQFRNALTSGYYLNPSAAVNLQRLLRSGLELPGREYYYASLRFNNVFKDQSQGLSFRYILSGLDGSGLSQLNWEKGVGDRWTFYLEGTINHGSDNSELVLFEHGALFLGAKAVF